MKTLADRVAAAAVADIDAANAWMQECNAAALETVLVASGAVTVEWVR